MHDYHPTFTLLRNFVRKGFEIPDFCGLLQRRDCQSIVTTQAIVDEKVSYAYNADENNAHVAQRIESTFPKRKVAGLNPAMGLARSALVSLRAFLFPVTLPSIQAYNKNRGGNIVMNVPIILAHGALGAFDEMIFLGIAVVFLGLMAVSWLKSRNMPDELEEPPADPTTPVKEPDSPDRFRLD